MSRSFDFFVDCSRLSAGGVKVGELLFAAAVGTSNVIKDLRENLRNLVGGELRHYEDLVNTTIERALHVLEEKARSKGYDGVLGVRISHPSVVEGGVEVVVYGNGFVYDRPVGDPSAGEGSGVLRREAALRSSTPP